MKVGITCDLKSDWKLKRGDPADLNAEFDKQETVDAISSALTKNGHQVHTIGNAKRLLSQIDDLGVDIVFNICEGYNGRSRESEVPVLLDMHRIPYVGADGVTLGITLDKYLAKKCFIADGIPTPKFFQAKDSRDLKKQNTIGFPLIVKTSYEGTSKGLTEQSKVDDFTALKRQVDLVTQTYDQPALVEEFIKGTEFTVAVIGNDHCEPMPVVQVSMDGSVDLGDKFYTFDRVTCDQLRYVCPAGIPQDLAKKMQELAVKVYKSVGCRDFGRVDFRVDDEGNPYVLEINPLPSLESKDIFNLFPQQIGSTYDATINKIFDHALARYGLLEENKEEALPSLNNAR